MLFGPNGEPVGGLAHPLVRSDEKHFCVVGKGKGTDKPRLFLREFGVRPNPQDVLNLAVARVRSDAQFREKFRGWQFCACRIDEYVEVLDDGKVVVRYRDQEGDW